MISKEKQRKLSKYQIELKSKATKSELIFKKRLDIFEIKYIFQKGFIAGNMFCIADFYLPKYKLVIEIDGGYHYNKKQIFRDKFKDIYYNSRGFHVLRIKNENVESFNIEKIYTYESIPNLKPKKNKIKVQKIEPIEHKMRVKKSKTPKTTAKYRQLVKKYGHRKIFEHLKYNSPF